MIKNGTRLASQVCDTQVIVVRAGDGLEDLRCGGVPMVALGETGSGDGRGPDPVSMVPPSLRLSSLPRRVGDRGVRPVHVVELHHR